jgi:osmotically inducible protein OsmC
MEEGIITKLELVVKVKVASLKDDQFQEIAKGAKQNCPVSKAYQSLEISLEANLENSSSQ